MGCALWTCLSAVISVLMTVPARSDKLLKELTIVYQGGKRRRLTLGKNTDATLSISVHTPVCEEESCATDIDEELTVIVPEVVGTQDICDVSKEE